MNTQPAAATLTTTIPRLVGIRELMQITGLSDTTLWRMRREGLLPEPIRVSRQRVGWPVPVIEAWIAERAAGTEDRAS